MGSKDRQFQNFICFTCRTLKDYIHVAKLCVLFFLPAIRRHIGEMAAKTLRHLVLPIKETICEFLLT